MFRNALVALVYGSATLLILFFCLPNESAAADLPSIWMAPLHPHDDPAGGRAGSEDYMNLFEPDAPWRTVEKHVAVFKIYLDFAQHASDQDIRKLAAGLSARNIALAVEAPVLTQTAWCQPGVPVRADEVTPLMARLKKLGANVRYLAMVGPLVDGHTYTKEFYCHRPIPEVAEDAAREVARIREIFPEIVVGDIEPVGRHDQYPDWSELDLWLDACKKALGAPLAFLHLDITWSLPWRDDVEFIAKQSQAKGVPLGVIFNGDSYDLSDADYAGDVALHVQQVTALPDAHIGDAVFQSWQIYPRRVLPEGDPSSMTGAILSYLRPATILELVGETPPGRVRVRLTDSTGAPVANAKIMEQTFEARGEANLLPQSMKGTTPAQAIAARFVLLAQEGCACPKRPTNIVITGFHYAEPDRPTYNWDVGSWATATADVTQAITVDGQRGLKIDAAPGRPLDLIGEKFPVTPDTPFDARFSWQVDPTSDGAGYAALIFIGPNGNEMHRDIHDMQPTWRTLGQEVTDAAGIAVIASKRAVSPGERFRFFYAGDDGHRPAPAVGVPAQ